MDYIEFVLAAYLVTALVLAGLIAWVIADGRIQARRLDELDRAGIGRRADREGGRS